MSSFFWYDYETFSLDKGGAGIAQFAGRRTSETLEPIGAPVMFHRQPPRDSWPSPQSCLITGITPQHCEQHGLADRDFADAVLAELGAPGTCGVGFNSLEFDDEFTRRLLFRNFYDPYEREWAQGNSRWDLFPALRFCHALMPEGIVWPVDEKGRVSLRLERLTAANGIAHEGAHDALADVEATIAMARLFREAQPQFFRYTLGLRSKHEAGQHVVIGQNKPLLLSSVYFGPARRYLSLVLPVAMHPRNSNRVIALDLGVDPSGLPGMDVDTLRQLAFSPESALPPGTPRPGLCTFDLNKSPMIASAGVLQKYPAVADRMGLDVDRAMRHADVIMAHLSRLQETLRALHDHEPEAWLDDCEYQLYAGFLPRADKPLLARVRAATPQMLASGRWQFEDSRLRALLWRYRARNHPESLSVAEREEWADFCRSRLDGKLHKDWISRADFLAAITEAETTHAGDAAKGRILQALREWEIRLR
jgi:exodeoxyribonuclease-1